MEKVIAVVGAAVGVALAVGLVVVMSTLVGAISGLLVGSLFEDSFVHLRGLLGLQAATNFEVGAIFGFIGGFFRSVK